MFLILSGKGASDIGVSDQEIGPMTKMDSLTKFTDRLNEVINSLGLQQKE
jgi:hypothetical protein